MARPRSNRAERTVLTYVKLDFQSDWEYHFDEYSFRPVKDQAPLLVVTEAPTGSLVTHGFLARRRPDLPNGDVNTTDNVIVPNGENIVYIPERCHKRAPGDQTTCNDQVVVGDPSDETLPVARRGDRRRRRPAKGRAK
jgi:hypothetical protein